MSRRNRHLFLALLAIAASAAGMGRKEAPDATPQTSGQPPQLARQFIAGNVEIWEGNFMPMIDPRSTRNKITPAIGRKIRIHEPVTAGIGTSLRDSVDTPIVAQAVTDSLGRFFVEIPRPGTFSVFVEEGGGWYSNSFSGSGIQGAVDVGPGQTVSLTLKITTKATY